jgi:hypothetical protein
MAVIGRRHVVVTLIVATVIAVALAYLHDPPWLLSATSGMRPWETDASGTRMRWMGGHASFFVPAEARAVEIPVRTSFERPDDWPIAVSVSIDDRPATRIVLTDDTWRRVVLVMPARGSRRVRRIDLRMDRTREDNRAAALGEVVAR